jgi:hypothetical protein
VTPLSDLQRLRLLLEDMPAAEHELAIASGTDAEFFVSNPPVREDSEEVRVDGVVQQSPADYIMGPKRDRIRFVTAPSEGAKVELLYARETFSDDELEAFLELAGADWAEGTIGHVYKAGVLALDSVLRGSATALDFSVGGGQAPGELTSVFDRLIRWRAVLSQQLAAESARPMLVEPSE